jgi:flagellar hook-basal body complex protein FliE
MEINPSSIYQEMQGMIGEIKPDPILNQGNQRNVSGTNFSDMLGQAINGVNELQATSRNMQNAFDMGDPNLSLADVMVAKEKSSVAFEATIQVRNKVLEAYKTIMNMPV